VATPLETSAAEIAFWTSFVTSMTWFSASLSTAKLFVTTFNAKLGCQHERRDILIDFQ
jgi:hypothetical protein